MAQLKSGSTAGGSVILTEAAGGFPAGTVMVFHQAAAPTGWTKSIANNDKALRVVSGVGGGTGGTHALTSPPSTGHTHTTPSHTHSTPNHTHSHSLSAGSHTLTLAQTPAHTHPHTFYGQTTSGNGNWVSYRSVAGGYSIPTQVYGSPGNRGGPYGTTVNSAVASNGGGQSHSHSMAGSITSGGSGTSGASGGTSGSSGPTAFAPKYIDVIVATKN